MRGKVCLSARLFYDLSFLFVSFPFHSEFTILYCSERKTVCITRCSLCHYAIVLTVQFSDRKYTQLTGNCILLLCFVPPAVSFLGLSKG